MYKSNIISRSFFQILIKQQHNISSDIHIGLTLLLLNILFRETPCVEISQTATHIYQSSDFQQISAKWVLIRANCQTCLERFISSLEGILACTYSGLQHILCDLLDSLIEMRAFTNTTQQRERNSQMSRRASCEGLSCGKITGKS